ncbi:MAG: hypothetical protein ACRCX2_10265 [Paraclostridium sp.]
MITSIVLTQIFLIAVILFGVKKGIIKFDICVKLLLAIAVFLIALLTFGG